MKNEDKAKFGLLIGGMAEGFGISVSAGRIKIYHRVLQDIPIDAIDYACEYALRNDMGFPPPARLREYAGLYRSPAAQHNNRPAIADYADLPVEIQRENLQKLIELLQGSRMGLEFAIDDAGEQPRLRVS